MQNKAIVWSQPNCAWCDRAKNLLTNNGYQVEIRLIDGETWSVTDLREHVPGAKTVPQVFINDEFVGGFEAVQKYLQV